MRALTVFHGGWTGLLFGAAAQFAFVATTFAAGALVSFATTPSVGPVAAFGNGLLLAGYATVVVPIGPGLGLLCGLVTGALATDLRVAPWSGAAVAVGVWALMWLVDPTDVVRSLTPWPPVGSPVLLVGALAAAVHSGRLRRWQRSVAPMPVLP